ncbi:hypothetical protein QQ045_028566 [Rhodiola kirilowii]
MASRFISSTVILLFLLSSSITSFFAQATSNADFVRYQAERLVKSFDLSPKESVNIVEDSLIEPAGFVDRKFIFPDLLLSNATTENLGHHAGLFEAHPEYVKNDFYITGESFAGHYIPVLASRVHKGNKAKEGIHINLKGFAIGNGITDPQYQYPAYTNFALANKLISQYEYEHIKKGVPGCVRLIQHCRNNDRACQADASVSCDVVFQQILWEAGNINRYDIRKKCDGALCYDFSKLENLLALNSVKKALGIGNIEFLSCSTTVYSALAGDRMKTYEPVIPPLLEDGIRVLIYVGEFDLICNWLGSFKWASAMKWSAQGEFTKANLISYKVGGKEIGLIKSFGPLTFLKVYTAGHMVPMVQPNVSLQMPKNWMSASTDKTH